MSRSWAWAFDVKVTYKGPDQKGVIRQWAASERIIGIGHGGMTEDEARAIAEKQLATSERTRQHILSKYPKGATATLNPTGRLYEQRLPNVWD